VIVPVAAASVSPAGRGFELEVNPQVYGVWPPLATSLAEYGCETWKFGNEVVVIMRGVAPPPAPFPGPLVKRAQLDMDNKMLTTILRMPSV
jgi:hypothetical protein